MGRKWRRKGGRNKGRGGGEAGKKSEAWASAGHGGDTQDWVASVVAAGNAQMEAFYAVQGFHNAFWDDEKKELKPVADFEAWQAQRLAWRKSMGQVLPASFRIHRDLPQALQEELSKEFCSLLDQVRGAKEEEDKPLSTHDGTGQPQARQLSFLPDGGIAYQLNVDRTSLRKHARLKPLHEWLKRVTDDGYITRQETVSMIPPAVLKPNPSDTVLDMCAAPGSKTSQLLEHLTEGCIVANDANMERAALLTHQLKRVASRNPACLVTACPAQFFPASVTKFTSNGGFDKALADVPCTGDGTSRKNIDVWHKWTVRGALNLHPLQLTIASRGVQLLTKENSYLCYSTCSQSPIENEAVVAELLRRFDELELVPVGLPGFRTRPGLTTWKVFDIENQTSRRTKKKQEEKASGDTDSKLLATHATDEQPRDGDDTEVEKDVTGTKRFVPTSMDAAHLMDCARQTGLIHYESYETTPVEAQKRLRMSVFPPSNANELHLERCLRVLPHDNDTGGFFVALLRKKADSVSPKPPSKKRARVDGKETAADEEKNDSVGDPNDADHTAEDTMEESDDLAGDADADNMSASRPTNSSKNVRGAEAFVPVADELLDPLIDYYGMDKSPSFRKDCFMCRVGSEAKVIHYVSPPVKAILDTGIQEKIHVLSGSIKGLTRNSMQQGCTASHRLAQEALSHIAPFMTKRKLFVRRDDFDRCLVREAVKISSCSPEFQELCRPLDVGSFVVILQDDKLPAEAEMLALVIWRCRGDNLKTLVTQADMDKIEKRTIFLLGPSRIAKQSLPAVENEDALEKEAPAADD